MAAALTTDEPQLATRFGRLLAPRLARETTDLPLTPPAGESSWTLATDGSGTLPGLSLVPSPEVEAPLAAGQVRVAVHAAGLNFKDLLITLGMVTGPNGLGHEGAGVVVAVGSQVHDFAPGDRVCGLIPNSFGPLAVVDHRLLIHTPPHLTDTQAATIPVAHTTAHEALQTLARLQPGEKILIHAATGAVGHAAIQLAHHLGADIYTTAHPDKWPTLHALGIPADHIANSRTPDFAHTLPTVDVILNSLTGPQTDASLTLLNPGGRFIELGKTDHRNPDTLPPGTEYHILDLSQPDPDHTRDTLDAIAALFQTGQLSTLPIRAFPITRAPQALRHMQQEHHTGKIILTIPQPPDPDGTTLITGGTGTLAALLAKHLLETGTA